MLRSFPSRSVFAMLAGMLVGLLCSAEASLAQTWQYIAPMKQARVWHQAQFLNNGKILVMGGEDGSTSLSSCELYDPTANTWSSAASMNVPRSRFQSLLLSDGRVFVAGGLTDAHSATTNTCEIYDPTTDVWTLTASMNDSREEFGLCGLPGNKIALIGGEDGNQSAVLSSADLYDVSAKTMTALPNQLQISADVAAVYSSISHSIYVAGGNQGGYGSWKLQTTQKFSLDTWQWTYVDSMINRQAAQFNTLIRPSTGEIFLFTNDTGYYYLKLTSLVEAMAPAQEQWNAKGTMTPRSDPRGVVIGDSAVFPGGIGPSGGGITNCTWFNFSTNEFSEGSHLLDSIMDEFVLATSKLPQDCSWSRKLYIIGGQTKPGTIVARCEVLDLGVVRGSLSLVHRESASAYFGQIDSLPLMLDVDTGIHLDSLWSTLTEMQGSYTWDSSLVDYSGYLPPEGWILNGLTNHGNSLDIDITNVSSTFTSPLDLGTALFRPKTELIASVWINLSNLSLITGSQTTALCVTDDEDNHWAVKTLGTEAGVHTSSAFTSTLSEVPNPVSTEYTLSYTLPVTEGVTLELYDVLGNRMLDLPQGELSAGTHRVTLRADAIA
ncbi:MAG TPA: kelch repeat-containing protein, partial [Candidatus Kapabacteria bacterium]